ncbi:MAG TPA: hypothetical protein VGC97_14755 [Pyrinomonadaceae bacterium]|jgi:hypothetical protein
MPFRPKHKKKSKNINLSEQTKEIIQKGFHEPIATIVKETGIPGLKPKLEQVFLESFRLRAILHETKDLKEISKTIEEKAVDVENRHSSFKQERQQKAQIEIEKHRREILERKEKWSELQKNLSPIPESDLEDDPDLKRLFIQTRETQAEIEKLLFSETSLTEQLRRHEEFVNASVGIETIINESLIRKYKRDKFLRKVLRQTIRFFTSVIGISVGVGYLVSETLKFLFSAYWGLILAGLVIWNITKEYYISPRLRNYLVEKERSDLEELLNIILSTEVQLAVGPALIKKREEAAAKRFPKSVDKSK